MPGERLISGRERHVDMARAGNLLAQGSVPISNFVERKAERTVGILNRIDGARTIVVQANVAAGMQVTFAVAAVLVAIAIALAVGGRLRTKPRLSR